MRILEEIVDYKKSFVSERKGRIPLDEIQAAAGEAEDPVSFFDGLSEGDDIAVISEIKKASPSKGTIREDFDPEEIADIYESNGASAISVLTDEKFFQGADEFLTRVRGRVDLPVLRKDFVVDPYQIYEARTIGAAAILLIASIMTRIQLEQALELCRKIGLDALVEVHTQDEAAKALDCGADIVGINNRDLQTFETSIQVTFDLMDYLPDDLLIVSESGIHMREDVVRLRDAGADAVLVGESLMREPDIGRKLRELTGSESEI